MISQARHASAELGITLAFTQSKGQIVTCLPHVILDSRSEIPIVIAVSVPEQLGMTIEPDEICTPHNTIGGDSPFLRVQEEGPVSVVLFDKTPHRICLNPGT